MISNFSIFQLVKNYGHIGGPSALTNINSLFYIVGRYYNVSIIDINKSLFLFRNYFFLISNVKNSNYRCLNALVNSASKIVIRAAYSGHSWCFLI